MLLIDGTLTTKKTEKKTNKKADLKKIHTACVLAKDKINAAMKEFIDSPIREDRETQHFAVLNVMTVFLKLASTLCHASEG